MPALFYLLAVVALFYWLEGWIGVPPQAVLLRSRRRGAYRAVVAGDGGIGLRERLVLAWTSLWPHRRVLVAGPAPVFAAREQHLVLSPLHTFAPLPEPAPGEQLPPPHRARVDGRTLYINQRPAPCVSVGAALAWARRVNKGELVAREAKGGELVPSQVSAGELLAREVNGGELVPSQVNAGELLSGEVEAVRERAARLVTHTRELTVACTMLTAYLFGVLPGIWAAGFSLPWGRVGLAYGVLLMAVQVLTWISHRRLYPEARAERIKLVLSMLLGPADAMAAARRLGRNILADADPMVAVAALAPTDLPGLGARALRSLEHPAEPRGEAGAQARAAIHQLLRGAGGAAQPQPEPPREEGCGSYCPRCLEQFIPAMPEPCPRCPHVARRVFSPEASRAGQL